MHSCSPGLSIKPLHIDSSLFAAEGSGDLNQFIIPLTPAAITAAKAIVRINDNTVVISFINIASGCVTFGTSIFSAQSLDDADKYFYIGTKNKIQRLSSPFVYQILYGKVFFNETV